MRFPYKGSKALLSSLDPKGATKNRAEAQAHLSLQIIKPSLIR